MATRKLPSHKRFMLLGGFAVAVVAGVALWGGSDTDAGLKDLAGVWTLTNTVSESSVKRFEKDAYVFEIYVTQRGDKLSGEGEQTLYNGRTAKSHFPIRFDDATVSGDQVFIRYTIQGNRTSTGMFTLRAGPEPNTLSGSFAGGAADSKGTTEVSIRRN